jgi:hypothetical protein
MPSLTTSANDKTGTLVSIHHADHDVGARVLAGAGSTKSEKIREIPDAASLATPIASNLPQSWHRQRRTAEIAFL